MKRFVLFLLCGSLAACQQTAPEATRTIKSVNIDMAKLPACVQSYPAVLHAEGPVFGDSVKHADTGEKPVEGISDPLDIQPFTGVPKVKGNCLTGVATDEARYRRNTFVMAGSGRVMQLKVGSQVVFLRAVDKDPDNFFEWWFKGHGYQVHVKMLHRQDSQQDTFLFDGYMEITCGGEHIVVPVYGGGGC